MRPKFAGWKQQLDVPALEPMVLKDDEGVLQAARSTCC